MKRLVVIIMIAILTMSMTACKESSNPLENMSKKELVSTVERLMGEVANKTAEVDSMQELLYAMQDGGNVTEAISMMENGKNTKTFNSINNKIMFMSDFRYPDSKPAPASSKIEITESISISPTSNWICTLNGASIELNHTDGIYGILKASKIDSLYKKEDMQENAFEPFFKSFGAYNTSYSNLFLDNDWWGMQAIATIYIDEEEAQLRCGMVGYANEALIYMFVYNGGKDTTKDELELTLLKTTEMYKKSLRLD